MEINVSENTNGDAPAKRVNQTKAELLAAGKIKTRKVTFPKSEVTLNIRNPRYARKQEILALFGEPLTLKNGETPDPEAVIAHDLKRNLGLQKAIMLECVVDDAGKPMFEDADWPELIEGDGILIGEVVAEVMGSLAAGKVREAGNASAQAPNAPSSSV